MRLLRKKIYPVFSRICAGERGSQAGAFGFFLLMLSFVYRAASAAHRKLSRRKRLECLVVSVGNIVCGGAGKTPAVEFIARMLIDKGCKTAVLSRGYMGSGGGARVVVSGGGGLLPGSSGGGDEPAMLAESLPGAAVISGKDRYTSGVLAIEEFGAACVILDDGFQHYSLARDVDVVVVDSTMPFGNGYLLPRGTLRETPGSLERADLLILTHVNFCNDTGAVKRMLFKEAGKKPLVEAVHMPRGFRGINTPGEFPPGAMKGKKAVALSGIARPELFERTLAGEGVEILESRRFPDHHPYTWEDIASVEETARLAGAECIITTVKDAVRIKPDGFGADVKIYAMKVCLEPVKGREELERVLLSRLEDNAFEKSSL